MNSPPMPRIAFIRPFTNRFVNPITRRVAGRLPGFAILEVPGRRTGRIHRIPLNIFRHGEAYVLALTYSSDVEWVRNVLAAGACTIVTRGRRVGLTAPELIVDRRQRLVPGPVRLVLRTMRVTEFLRMRAASSAAP
jgi:deazaflavin-dependent oxidoreductase (nitroreductase family)